MDLNQLALGLGVVGAVGALGSTIAAVLKERPASQKIELPRYKSEAPKNRSYVFDVFLSYAKEDASPLAKDLATALEARDLKVWFDEEQTDTAEHLSRVADAVARSKYGLVILSPSYLAETKVGDELDALSPHGPDSPPLFEILSGVDASAVRQRVPQLGANFQVSADEVTPAELADKIAAVVLPVTER